MSNVKKNQTKKHKTSSRKFLPIILKKSNKKNVMQIVTSFFFNKFQHEKINWENKNAALKSWNFFGGGQCTKQNTSIL